MPEYKYTAQDRKGKKAAGVLFAANETELSRRLKSEGLLLIKAKENKKIYVNNKINARQIADFCRELGTLLGAGVSLVRALRIISLEETVTPKCRAIYETVLDEVRKGVAMSDAMENVEGAFPELLINMIRTGEAGGNMDKIAMRMASHYEKSYRLSKKVSGAMIYPAILLFMIFAVTIFICAFIVPQFSEIFAQLPEIPATTRFLLAFSNFITQKWYVAIMILAAIVVLVVFILSIPQVKLKMDKLKVHLPYVGKLMKIIYTARFSRTINSLYSAGLPLVSSLTIASKTIGNRYIEGQFGEVISAVRRGQPLSQSIAEVDGFVRKLSDALMVGEETGNIDTMLEATADALEYESEMAVNKMITMVEPALIIVMAVIVGFVMLSVLSPIYSYYNTMQYSTYI